MIKKILYICSVYKPNIGGVETTIEELIKNFRKIRINTVVLTKKYPFYLQEKEYINNCLILRMQRPKKEYEYLESLNFIKKYQNELKADVVHIIGVRRPLPLYGLLLSKLWKVPYIITFAGGDIPDSNDSQSIELWEEGKDIISMATLQADNLTAFSKYTAKIAKKLISPIKKIDIIYAGIDLKKIEKIKKHREKFKYFFSARRLEKSKGIDILINAFFKIKNKIPKIKLLIAGDGPEKISIIKLIKKLKLENDVILLGFLKHSEIISYMKGAVAHICPSRAESGGIVNYEAQAAKCLAIGSNAGGIPEYIKNKKTGLIFPNGDINSLCKLLLFSLNETKEVENIKKEAIKSVSENTWEKFSNKYLDIYQKLHKEYQYKPFIPCSDITKKMWQELKILKV